MRNANNRNSSKCSEEKIGGRPEIYLPKTVSQSEELVKKATFYFTQKAVFLLKQAVLFTELRVHRIKTNKSEVMREALEVITSDFLENRFRQQALREARRLAAEALNCLCYMLHICFPKEKSSELKCGSFYLAKHTKVSKVNVLGRRFRPPPSSQIMK